MMCNPVNCNPRLVFRSLLRHLKREVLMTTTIFTLRDRLSMYRHQLLQLIGLQAQCLRPLISAARRLLHHPHIQR